MMAFLIGVVIGYGLYQLIKIFVQSPIIAFAIVMALLGFWSAFKLVYRPEFQEDER